MIKPQRQIAVSDALCIYQDLFPQPPRELQIEHHYLLYVSFGAMRLEAEGAAWSLPPDRAALVAAGTPVRLLLNQKMSVCSVLFSSRFAPAPRAALSVFEMTPLAREIVKECGRTGEEDEPLSEYRLSLFRTLQMVTWRLAETPSKATIPTGRSRGVIRALAITESLLAEPLRFEDVSRMTRQTPRTLARRLLAETGQRWGEILRRMRMIRAIEMLAETDLAVTEIALSVGYQSLSAFNASFRSFTGQTPTAYRDGFKTSSFGR